MGVQLVYMYILTCGMTVHSNRSMHELLDLLNKIPEGSSALESILCRTSVGTLKPLNELSGWKDKIRVFATHGQGGGGQFVQVGVGKALFSRASKAWSGTGLEVHSLERYYIAISEHGMI